MTGNRNRERIPWSGAVTLLAFVALVAGPILSFGIDRWDRLTPGSEWLRWQAAHSLVLLDHVKDEHDQAQALSTLERTADHLSEDLWLQRQLVEHLCDVGRADEGLARCEERIRQSADQPGWLKLKSNCQMALGQFEPALATLQQYYRSQPQPLRPTRDRLNEFAYHRALASTNLDLAAAEIQQAIDRESTEASVLPKLSLLEKTVLATSLLSRYSEDQPLALPLLNRLVSDARLQSEASDQALADALLSRAEADFPLGNSAEQSVQVLRLVRDADRQTFACLLATRALLLDDLGRVQECDYDRATVIQLGFDEQDLLDRLPDDGQCAYVLMRGMAYLDTRGFIHSLRPWSDPAESLLRDSLGESVASPMMPSSYPAALADLDAAVAASRVLKNALESHLAIVVALSPDEVEQQRQAISQTQAAVYYHRMLAHQRAGNSQLAEIDKTQIEALGFSPGPHLH